MSRRLLPAGVAFGVFFITHLQAASLVPTGVSIQVYPATGANSTRYIGIPLSAQPVFAGPVAGLTATTVQFTGNPFTANEFKSPAAPFFAMVLTGTQKGRTMRITSNSANSITLDVTENSVTSVPLTQAGFSMQVADTIQIVPGDTLATFFGSSASTLAAVKGGTTSALADNVLIFNKATALFDTYWFNTTTGTWVRNGAGTANANNTILYPEGAMGILRRAGRPATLAGVTGDIALVPPLSKITGGNTSVVTSMRYPVNLTLGALIPTALNVTGGGGFLPGGSLTAGSNLSIYNSATNRWDVYYLNGSSWFDRTNANANAVAIPSGAAVSIFTRNARTPAGPQSYFSTTFLPY